MKKKPKHLGPVERVFEISPLYLARVIFVAALSFVCFLGMLLGFYMREQIGYFILSSAFLIVYLLTMLGWFFLKRQRLEILEKGLSYRRRKILWEEIVGIDDLEGKSFLIKASDGTVIQISDVVSDWHGVRKIVTEKTGF